MAKKIDGIRLFITDLDNTLYDWYVSFVPAFYAMVDVAADILNVDKEQLLDEIKLVHVRYHNSEQPFAILETPSVERKFPKATQLERKHFLDPAFRVFSEVRKKHLHLFPGVRHTLNTIRGVGCLVVGHTEAVVENSLYRGDHTDTPTPLVLKYMRLFRNWSRCCLAIIASPIAPCSRRSADISTCRPPRHFMSGIA